MAVLFGDDYDAVFIEISDHVQDVKQKIRLKSTDNIYNKYNMTDIFEYIKNIKPLETQDSTTISETNINFDSDDDYDISEITEHTTSHNVNLTGDDIFIKHNMINLILLIKQFKRIKNIIQDIQLEVSNINETYDIPQLTEYTFDTTKFQIINVFKIIWLRNITKTAEHNNNY